MLQIVNRNNQATQVVPLKNVNIHSTIRSFAADVTITQVFRNDEAIPIEAVYCFPIEEQAAIYAFVTRIDNREIVAELKEKKEAQKDYTEALEQGHGAYLMEQDEKSQDNFIINLKPLKWLEQHAPTQGQSRQIFLLTDGEISNVTEVLDLCRSMASSTRIFSFGLGHSPSRSLVKGLARSTNGRFVFIPPNSTVDVYVGEQLQKALQRCITNVGVKWNFSTAVVETIPNQLPPVYAKDRLIVYGLLDDKSIPFDHNSSVELQVDQQQLSVARISRTPSISENGMIARLAAKALILELQHAKRPAKRTTVGSRQSRFQDNLEESNDSTISKPKEIEKKRIIELSLKHKILSPHTAFIGIEKRTDGNNAHMALREVPIQISADDQHLRPTLHKLTNAARSSSINFDTYSTYNLSNCFHGDRALGRRDFGAFETSTKSISSKLRNKMGYRSDYRMASSRRRSRSRSRSRSPPNREDYFLNRSNKHIRNVPTQSNPSEWPSNDQDIVRHLIDKQNFNGLWHLDAESIRHLTGKSLANFQSIHTDIPVLISAIVLILLETRFGAFVSMWHGVAQKARTIIIEKLGKDPKNLEILLENIREQL
ncbi:unnamed protein product [Rotaria sordida]|uniref:VIT domain-containing protein n=1 Tax=Rotaria sordida TaxID=392033 RepID=A0A815DWR4_9BILA|nr:unnamed protein product [Rotaria sordida]CAF3994969.1 unnamed protein product [Rotaria sordida]